MITIATCFDYVEANRLRTVLESAGIAVFIPDENTASLAPHFLMASGVRVQVPEEVAEQARQVLAAEGLGDAD